jgi:hypothetical protein
LVGLSISVCLCLFLSLGLMDSKLHFVSQCLNRLNSCSLSLTAKYKLHSLVRTSEDVFSFIRDGAISNLDWCSQRFDSSVCCLPSVFPVLSHYLKIDHVCSLLNAFQFILLTALLSDDEYCDVRCWQGFYFPQRSRTT